MLKFIIVVINLFIFTIATIFPTPAPCSTMNTSTTNFFTDTIIISVSPIPYTSPIPQKIINYILYFQNTTK